jgi:PAS domain S-box-containing protein
VQEYRIVYLNTALATMFGYTREEATGMPVLETIFPEDRTMVARRIQERIDGVTKDAHYSFRGTRKDHRVIEVEVHSTRVEFEGKPAVIGTFIDITERRQIEESIRKAHEELEQRVEERTLELSHANTMLSQQIIERERTEEQLQRAREAAEAANHAKSIFLANMSHELRTPLNAILGFAQLLDSRRTSSKEYQDYVRIILRSGEHLLTLINDVLDMSKIEAGRMSLQHTHFDLYRMLDDLHDMFHLRAQEKQLALHVERMTDVPRFIYADEKKLRQVLINLISNAIKFTDEGSVSVFVTIDREHALLTHDQEPYPGEPTSRRSEPVLLRFAVADTGSGIEMHEITTLFEAFAQTTSGQYANEGTGLGLAISRKFVQLMGGDMEVQSQVGGGTTFSFHIIVQTAHGQPTQLHQEKREVVGIAPGQPRYRILVVDDRWDNRHLIVQLLAPLKYEIREASNGQEAVSLCTEWEPDLIFMDMHMPVMDGYEATRRIKAATCGTHPIIIAVTASIFEEERSVMLSAGCNDLLYKPFRNSDFFSMLQKHLDTHYLYADRIPTTPLDKDEPPPLIADSLAHLPHDLVVHLNHAAVLGELDLLTQTLEQIYDNDEVLAAILHEMVEAFQFEHIARLTEEVMNANATKSGSAGRAGTGDE